MNPCPIIPEAPNTTIVFDMMAFLVAVDVPAQILIPLLKSSQCNQDIYPVFYSKNYKLCLPWCIQICSLYNDYDADVYTLPDCSLIVVNLIE